MLKRMKLFVVAALSVVSLAMASLANAALSAADQTSIISGISSSDTVFFAIGGAILVVLCGIWGFKKVKGLLGS
jgi:hypothetical protein